MITPSDGSLLLITSQNATLVLMPMPSGVGQIMSASSVLGATGAGAGRLAAGAGFRVCAATVAASVAAGRTADSQCPIDLSPHPCRPASPPAWFRGQPTLHCAA